ncbi:ParB/RepB/Spo0J family partition protein [Intrasporangium sp. DVR]|uniref:ParB/RepB/Spo0J family partition protein n=1 Tax=Intrasporangium sp. DVR TaxID=3127867 RepID=UPI00313A55F4
MAEKRRALGRGLGALIPSAPSGSGGRPVDVFFTDQKPAGDSSHSQTGAPNGGGPDQSTLAQSPNGQQPVPTSAVAPDSPAADLGGLAPVPGAEFAEIGVDLIRPNPKQPRSVFDEDDMAELVHSIREIGVLQPIVVRRIPADQAVEGDGKHYELIMGERRWRATQAAELETIPAIIKDTQDDALLRDALLENLHRSQLNALEEAAAYQQLLDDFGCSHEELAHRIGRSRPQISNTLRLLKLPPLVQRRVAAGVLSAGHARALLGLSDGAAMERMAQRIVAEGLSVRTVEELVSLGDGDVAPKPRRPRAGTRHPQLDEYTSGLADYLETRVAISLGQRKGKITVEFASVEDLKRILGIMGIDSRS